MYLHKNRACILREYIGYGGCNHCRKQTYTTLPSIIHTFCKLTTVSIPLWKDSAWFMNVNCCNIWSFVTYILHNFNFWLYNSRVQSPVVLYGSLSSAFYSYQSFICIHCDYTFTCPLHARGIMSTCNIIVITCDLFMSTCNIITLTCNTSEIIMLHATKILLHVHNFSMLT